MLQRLLSPSLFKRMFAAQALVVLCFVAVNGLLVWWSYSASDAGVIDQDLKLIAEASARMAAMRPDAEGARWAAEQVEEMNRSRSDPPIHKQEFAFQIWSADGRLLARSDESPRLPELRPADISRRERTEVAGWLMMAAASPRGEVVAIVGYSRVMLDRVMRRTLTGLLPLLGMALAQAGLAMALASRVGLRPLTRLSRHIAERRARDDSPLPEASHRELRPIVAAMNGLLDQQRRQRLQERAFFADAAHELRTPLAVINAQAHALATTRTEAERRQALSALESGVGRSADVLDKLLTLARLEAGGPAPSPQPVDVAALARAVVAHQLDRTGLDAHDLGVQTDGPAWALAQPQALQAALDNLVDNALHHTPPGSRVDVSVTRQGDRVVVSVEDSGSGIPEPERERVFERFERGSNAAGRRGSGLGLSIVSEAMRQCGGDVSLDSSPTLGGARLQLKLHSHPGPLP